MTMIEPETPPETAATGEASPEGAEVTRLESVRADKERARAAIAAAIAADKIGRDSTFDAVRFQIEGEIPAWILKGAWEEARPQIPAPPAPEWHAPPGDALHEWEHPAGDTLPTIRIEQGGLARAFEETIAALATNDRNLFQRNGELVTIVREPERAEPYDHDVRRGRDILTRPGTPRLRKIGLSGLTLRAARCAQWERWKEKRARKGEAPGGDWVAADPDSRTLGLVFAPDDEWPGINPVRGILETPALTPSFRIIETPGYDAETGYVLLPSCDLKPILERPTRDHARAALRYLWTEIACDFPFRGIGEPNHETDPDCAAQYLRAVECPDAFVGVAMLLTIFARLAINGAVPGGLFEAPGQGSGKSLQMHTISIVATSRPASVATFPMRDGKANEEELEKVCAGYALAGARIIAFDNIRGLLSGATLEKVLTAVKAIDLRVLGANDQRSLEWFAVTMFSGNNMVMNDDVAQRMLCSRLESTRENPRSRPASTFRHPELLDAIGKRRAHLVRAVLTILRGYHVAREANDTRDMDDPGTLGSYEAWSRIVPPALVWAGGPNILRAQPEFGRGGDEESAAHECLMRGWRDEWNGQRASYILEKAFEGEAAARAAKRQGLEHPSDGLDELRSAIRMLLHIPENREPSGQAFGTKLYRLRQKIRDGMRIAESYDKSAKANLYRVERSH